MMSPPCEWCSRGHELLRAPASKFSPRSSHSVEGGGLGKGGNSGHRLRSKVAFANDQVKRFPGGSAAAGDRADDLAFEALGVEAALAGDDGVGAGEAGVEVESVEEQAGAGTPFGAGGPEAPGEAAGAAAHRHAAGVAGELGGECFQPLGQALDG